MIKKKLISKFYIKILEKVKSGAGFTLIELLIVIAIIGILATIIIVNFVGVRQRSRDAQRKADLRQIQSAIELFKADQNSYPLSASFPVCGNPLLTVTITYMQKIPCDPSGASYWNSGNYYYSLDGATYILGACLENANDTDSQATSTSPSGASNNCPNSPNSKYYVLTNP